MTLATDDWRSWPTSAKLTLRRRLWAEVGARPEQLPPPGDWRVWYLQGGRGSGKTRASSEALADWVADNPGEYAVIAPTYGDARDVCVEGPSGLIQRLGPMVTNWNRSFGELRINNGSVIWADGADDGALRIQGRNLRGAWCDEVGLWRNWERAWHESLSFAVRLPPARIIVSGTPKRGHGLVELLVKDERVPKSRLRTADNLAHLAPDAIVDLQARYAGTSRGRQELEGEWLEDVDGALWERSAIEEGRRSRGQVPELVRVVVAVDPAVTSGENADETGIVVCGLGSDGHGYMLADESCRLSPDRWARRAVRAYEHHRADRVVAEVNNGGDLVEVTLRAVDPSVPYRKLHASRGKRLRAEPVAALYEQGRVHHVGAFEELEDQLCGWTADARTSPDRMDALVWALTDLMLEPERRVLRFRGAA